MKRVLERLMDTVVAVDDDDEEEEAEQTNGQFHKSVHCSLSTLCDWYNTKTKVGDIKHFSETVHKITLVR